MGQGSFVTLTQLFNYMIKSKTFVLGFAVCGEKEDGRERKD